MKSRDYLEKVPTMPDRSGVRGRSRILASVRPVGEGQSTTTFELLFDLVYVFALTRVSAYMAAAHSAHGILQGILLLALLWWTWGGYTWLGNQARADEGVVRAGMAVAMAAIFVVDLTIPEAWQDAPGGLNGPIVLVCAYLLVRCVHLVVDSVAAADDTGLRRQVAIAWVPFLASAVLLLTGVLLGGSKQTFLFAGAVILEWVVVYLTARQGNWRLRSAAHWTERHGLFIILAIGESILAVGIGAAGQPVSTPLLVAAVMGIAIAICLWWLYFDVVSLAAERRLHEVRGQARTKMAVEAYSYGHFPIVAGVVLAAVGVEGVLAHAGEGKPLGPFYASALFGGTAAYIAGHLVFKNRVHSQLNVTRLLAVGVLLACLPAAALLPALAGLALLVFVLTSLVAIETIRYAEIRSNLRSA